MKTLSISNLVFVVGALSIIARSTSADLMIGVDGSTDIQFNPENAAPTITINIQNSSGSADLVVGWSLGLQVVPEAGAVGTLAIESATLPSSDYLFAGRSQGLSTSATFPTTSLMPIFDSDTQDGLVVSTFANLLSVTLNTTDAVGKFKVVAFGNKFNGTNITKVDGQDFPTVPLDNLAFENSFELASITVVPEPSPFVFLVLVGLIVWLKKSRTFMRGC